MGHRSETSLWWQTGVIYQIYPRSFQDSNGDGTGDLNGITQRLDYLAETLGVDAIWLSPFYPSPMKDFGYDITNYLDVDPIFGTLEDFDRLVAEAHARDLQIIVDFVPNHTSEEHPWFQESRSSRGNQRREWYVWRDPSPDGGPPNNWLAVPGGSAWELDEHTGQYYLHSFLKEQPDLNWRNPLVEDAMFDVLRFWLERGVDGFRIDMAQRILKDPDFRDNPPDTSSDRPYKSLGRYDSQLHVYDQGHPDIHAVYRRVRHLLDSYSSSRPRMAGGEIHIFDYSQWASYYGIELDELHLPFNFGLIGVPWEAAAVRRVVDSIEGVMRPGSWPNYVLGNHDEHRIATRAGEAQARVAMMLLLTLRGTPTVYYGDELGMTDVPIPAERIQDPWERTEPGLGLGRDPERTPMQWDASPNSGFCPPEARPWLPISENCGRVNVQQEYDDAGSMLSLARTLLTLRRQHPSLHLGSYHPVELGESPCFAYWREEGDERHLVALNFTGESQNLHIPNGGGGRLRLSTTNPDSDLVVDLARLTLSPNEGCIVDLRGR